MLESFAHHLPSERVTSAELEARLSRVYERLEIPLGTLQRLSGVNSRYHWGPDVKPSDGAVVAVERALQRSELQASDFGALINCSITRDSFEPATACIVHDRLGLPEDGMAMDVSNACAGVSSGILLLAHLIERGTVRAGIVVACETMTQIVESTLRRLERDDTLSRADFMQLLPSLTLGSGAVALLLCHKDLATGAHAIRGCASRTASNLSGLCVGNGDFCFESKDMEPIMHSDSARLLGSVGPIARRAQEELLEQLDWDLDNVDHVLAHQVGRAVDAALFNEVGLDENAHFRIYDEYGNQASAALPISMALAAERGHFTRGERLLLMGFGSGLNVIATGIEW